MIYMVNAKASRKLRKNRGRTSRSIYVLSTLDTSVLRPMLSMMLGECIGAIAVLLAVAMGCHQSDNLFLGYFFAVARVILEYKSFKWSYTLVNILFLIYNLFPTGLFFS